MYSIEEGSSVMLTIENLTPYMEKEVEVEVLTTTATDINEGSYILFQMFSLDTFI